MDEYGDGEGVYYSEEENAGGQEPHPQDVVEEEILQEIEEEY